MKKRVLLLGKNSFVAKEILNLLQIDMHSQIFIPERSALDLTKQHAVRVYFQDIKPDEVYLLAAKQLLLRIKQGNHGIY